MEFFQFRVGIDPNVKYVFVATKSNRAEVIKAICDMYCDTGIDIKALCNDFPKLDSYVNAKLSVIGLQKHKDELSPMDIVRIIISVLNKMNPDLDLTIIDAPIINDIPNQTGYTLGVFGKCAATRKENEND